MFECFLINSTVNTLNFYVLILHSNFSDTMYYAKNLSEVKAIVEIFEGSDILVTEAKASLQNNLFSWATLEYGNTENTELRKYAKKLPTKLQKTTKIYGR